ncbi:MAG: hypothetical protein ABIP21_10625 [Acidimicrobiia bacterium]
MSMSIDLTEPIAAGQHLADAVRRRTGEGVDAVRDVDIHLPVAAEAVIAAASHRARRARRHANHAARDTRRSIETHVDRSSRRVRRRAEKLSEQSVKPGFRVWVIGALLVGGAGVIAAVVLKQRSCPNPPLGASSVGDLNRSDLNGSGPVTEPSPAPTIVP